MGEKSTTRTKKDDASFIHRVDLHASFISLDKVQDRVSSSETLAHLPATDVQLYLDSELKEAKQKSRPSPNRFLLMLSLDGTWAARVKFGREPSSVFSGRTKLLLHC